MKANKINQMPAYQVFSADNGETIGTFRSILDASELAKKIGLHRVNLRTVWMEKEIWKAMA